MEPPGPRTMKITLQGKYLGDMRKTLAPSDDGQPPILFGGILNPSQYPAARRGLRAAAVKDYLEHRPPSKLLLAQPPDVDPSETLLPRVSRTTLAQLRSGYCSRLASYRHSVGWSDTDLCPDCQAAPQTSHHLFNCPEHPTDLSVGDLWTAPLHVVQFLSSTATFNHLPSIEHLYHHLPP